MKKIIVPFLLFFILLSCPGPDLRKIEYYVECIATPNFVDIKFIDENDEIIFFQDITPPWSYSFIAEPGTQIEISAQNLQDNGDLTASIYIDDDLFRTGKSSWAYGVVTVRGYVPYSPR